MAFNKIILDLRNYHGVSQKQVADSVGISQSTIAKIEIGRNEATASTIRKLADYFQVSADYLLERSEDNNYIIGTNDLSAHSDKVNKNEQELLDWYRGLPSNRARESFLSFIRSDSQYTAKKN